MNKTQQGDIGVATAVLHYSLKGYFVLLPTTEQIRYDLAIDASGTLSRVQVKTSGYQTNGIYRVGLRTNGANYTTKNNHKKISSDEIDFLFVLAGDGTAYEFPAHVITGMSEISLGQKYKQYIVGQYNSLR
jgi:hypothetical protein